MTKLECLAIDLGIITANDLERHTALQLILLIIERLNEVIDKLNHIDLELLNQLRGVIAELVDNGTISSLLADGVYSILNKRLGDAKNIDEYQAYVENDNWGLALQQAIKEGYKNIIFTNQSLFFYEDYL